MPESNELFNELANLRDQVDDMSRSVSAIARQSGLKEQVLDVMRSDPLLASIFLLIDGVRTQKDIVQALKGSGVGGSQATVSRKIDSLVEDWDLVRPTRRTAEGMRYVHTSLAKDLKIARSLEKAARKPARHVRKRPSAK